MRNTITKSGGDYYKTLLQQQERPIRRKGTNGRGDYDFLNNAADDDRPMEFSSCFLRGSRRQMKNRHYASHAFYSADRSPVMD